MRETTEETAGKAAERRMCPTEFEWNGGQIGNGICKDPGIGQLDECRQRLRCRDKSRTRISR